MTTTLNPFTTVPAGTRAALFDELARTGPVQRYELPGFGPFWLVTGYAEVRAALSEPLLTKAPHPMRALAEALRPELAPALFGHMLASDGDVHTRLRKLLAGAFTPRRMNALAGHIQEISDELLAGLADVAPDETVDLMEIYAYPLPMRVIFELMGLPGDLQGQFHRLFTAIMDAMSVPEAEFVAALEELVSLLRDQVQVKRTDPGEDLISALTAAHDTGDRLSDDELTAMMWLITVAGHETTTNLIGNGMRALLLDAEQAARLRVEPELIPSAVEELLRHDSPVHCAYPLVAQGELTLGQVVIHAREKVIVGLMAANHDRALGEHLDRLDVTRPAAAHVAFGHGVHFCLGAQLARIEGRIALTDLLTRYPDMTLAVEPGDLRLRPHVLLNGLADLPIRLGKPAGR